MEITFLRPLYLTLLISIPFFVVMHFLILKHIKRKALKFANFDVIQRATGGEILNKNVVILVIRLAALILLIFSVSGTTFWYTGKSADSDYVIAIDASSSMLANDFLPTRFAAAKEAGVLFVDKLPPKSRIGLVSFSGTSFVELQPTQDRETVKEKIREMEIKPVGGTDLGEAIITSANMLSGTDKSKVLVLLTDGQSNVGTDPLFGAEYANKELMNIFTIGVATAEGGSFSRLDMVSKLDEGMLQQIAKSSGGSYYLAKNKEDLNAAYESISQQSIKNIAVSLQLPLMLASLFLLFVEWGLINTKYRTLP
jgi:Ca-activated chloride channel family protein